MKLLIDTVQFNATRFEWTCPRCGRKHTRRDVPTDRPVICINCGIRLAVLNEFGFEKA